MNHTSFIKDKIKQIPELPGIYKMLDSRGNIIYIGKSKCLKKRVQSYFVNSPKWEKVKKMVSMITDIEYIVTDTHLEARLLECKLIKEIQPRFNAQMKNDQRYIYIKISANNKLNPLSVSVERDDDCFGPFRSKYAISEFLDRLKNIYPIIKTDTGYEFEYHLFHISMEEEAFERNRMVLQELFTLEDNIPTLLKAFQQKLEEAVSQYRFEMAAVYRDMMQSFMNIKNGLDGYKNLASKKIILKLPIQNGFKLFFISNGTVIHSQITTDLSDKKIRDFIAESKIMLSSAEITLENEKSQIDYRDIMYSEISDIPEEMYEILPSSTDH
jgi:excinuclease ABC subunit C